MKSSNLPRRNLKHITKTSELIYLHAIFLLTLQKIHAQKSTDTN